jgi:hypothetical protein
MVKVARFTGGGTSFGQRRVLVLAEFEDGDGEDGEKDSRISPAQHLKKLIFPAKLCYAAGKCQAADNAWHCRLSWIGDAERSRPGMNVPGLNGLTLCVAARKLQ